MKNKKLNNVERTKMFKRLEEINKELKKNPKWEIWTMGWLSEQDRDYCT